MIRKSRADEGESKNLVKKKIGVYRKPLSIRRFGPVNEKLIEVNDAGGSDTIGADEETLRGGSTPKQ